MDYEKHKTITPPQEPGHWDGRKQEPIVEDLRKYISAGMALDMGAGWPGRDAFYLASQGFDVTAAEIDDECIEELTRRNKTAQNPLEIIKAGVLDYRPKSQFDVVICDMVLHFLSSEQIPQAIANLQAWTKTGGYNVVTAYTSKNPAGKRPYLFGPQELARYYSDWELLEYREEPTPWFHLEGEPDARRNEAVYLLARKP